MYSFSCSASPASVPSRNRKREPESARLARIRSHNHNIDGAVEERRLARKEELLDNVYFTVDTEDELAAKWPRILAYRPDFIKTDLWYSDEFERRRNDPAFAGRKGLDPRLVRQIVERAHAAGLRVSAHTVNGADFRNAVNAGVDEIVHVPAWGAFPAVEQRMARIATNALDEAGTRQITADLGRLNPRDPSTLPLRLDDARLAAKRGTVVVTTMNISTRAPAPLLPLILAVQRAGLRTLIDGGAALAIGSDNVGDSSVLEAEHLHSLGVFDTLALLKLWGRRHAQVDFSAAAHRLRA